MKRSIAKNKPTRRTRKAGSFFWLGWILAGSILFWGCAFIGAELGFRAGRQVYRNWESVEVARWCNEQYIQGLQDIQAGNYDIARQRLGHISSINPQFPGVVEQLEILGRLRPGNAAVATIFVTLPAPPTYTPTPTPDKRPLEELFTQVKMLFNDGNWNGVIDTLVNLRKADLSYRVVEVDGYLYLALRNRGLEKIQKQGNPEGGIYDLTMAEHFGPLDATAYGLRELARLFMIGLSFWDVYPEKAVYYLGQVASAAGYLRDPAGWTASERYREALIQYAEQLARNGDWCSAVIQYELALGNRFDSGLDVSLEYAREQCSPSTPTLTPSISASPTPPIVTTEAPPVTPTWTEEIPPTTESPPTPTYTEEEPSPVPSETQEEPPPVITETPGGPYP